jgi:hypothetical protein
MLVQVANFGAISSPALNGVDGTCFRRVECGTMGFGTHGLSAHKESDYVDRMGPRQTSTSFEEAEKAMYLFLK